MNLANIFKSAKDAKDYPAGKTIFAQGDPSDVMYVVLEGDLDLLRGGQSLGTVSAGAIVGEMALIDKNAPRSGLRWNLVMQQHPGMHAILCTPARAGTSQKPSWLPCNCGYIIPDGVRQCKVSFSAHMAA